MLEREPTQQGQVDFGPSTEIVLCIGQNVVEEARRMYFGLCDDRYQGDEPEMWPYFQVVVNTPLEGELVRAIAPRKAQVDIVTPDEMGRPRRLVR